MLIKKVTNQMLIKRVTSSISNRVENLIRHGTSGSAQQGFALIGRHNSLRLPVALVLPQGIKSKIQ